MNEGIHLDLDTWIVPGQIRKANLCRGLGNRYTPAGTGKACLLVYTQIYTWFVIIIIINRRSGIPIPPTVIRPGLGACKWCDRCL